MKPIKKIEKVYEITLSTIEKEFLNHLITLSLFLFLENSFFRNDT
jgi:hypothetical protein